MVQILICQNLRNNLQHPNEYIRGVTLRFLCRIREEEILEPLIPSILACLEHRHSYVRRNAVLAINALYKLPKGELLLVDAPELIEKVWKAIFYHFDWPHMRFDHSCKYVSIADHAVHCITGASVGAGSLHEAECLPDALQPCTTPGSQLLALTGVHLSSTLLLKASFCMHPMLHFLKAHAQMAA